MDVQGNLKDVDFLTVVGHKVCRKAPRRVVVRYGYAHLMLFNVSHSSTGLAPGHSLPVTLAWNTAYRCALFSLEASR